MYNVVNLCGNKRMKNFILLSLLILSTVLIHPQAQAQTGVADILDKSTFLEITIPENTALITKLQNTINTETSKPGEEITFELDSNYIIDDQVILSKKSIFTGTITNINRTSLIDNTYDIIVEINKLNIPFKGDYKISAHPDFKLKKHKKKRGFFFSIRKNKDTESLIDDMENKKVKDSYKKEDKDPPVIIEKDELIDVIFDKPFTIIVKQ